MEETKEKNKEYLKKILKTIAGTPQGVDEHGEEFICFEKIDPMPKELRNTTSPNSEPIRENYTNNEEYNEDHEKEYQKDLKKYQKQLKLKEKYGVDNWYDWHCTHWGTKWDAYQSQDEGPTATGIGHIITFQTAWSTPTQIIKTLSEKFPSAKFEIMYADEDIGNNCGNYICIKGNLENLTLPDDQEEFACELWGNDYEEYIADKEEWEKQEEPTNEFECSHCHETKGFIDMYEDGTGPNHPALCLECVERKPMPEDKICECGDRLNENNKCLLNKDCVKNK